MKKILLLSLIAIVFSVKQVNAQQDNTVYNFVSLENPPTYPGGMAKFYEFLGSNIHYPAEAKEAQVEGNVHVSFTVEKDGSLTDIKVARKLGSGTDEEAVRVLTLSKPWNPGRINGEPVRVKYNIPIKFSLQGRSSGNAGGKVLSDTAIFSFVSVTNPPTYPGGIESFYSFLNANLKYPKEAADRKLEATVFASFVVEKDGSITNIKVMDRDGYGLGEEALRVIKLSKSWNPGLKDGKPVRVRYNIPVKFSLKK